jgi:hypothetical protein
VDPYDGTAPVAGSPCYQRPNALPAEASFDDWVEKLCAPYYAVVMGRHSIPAGVYVRMILMGYVDGLYSQRGIAWWCSDRCSLANFLGHTKRREDSGSFEPDLDAPAFAGGNSSVSIRVCPEDRPDKNFLPTRRWQWMRP